MSDASIEDVIELPADAELADDVGASARPQRKRNDVLYHSVILAVSVAVLLLAATMSVREGQQVLVPLLNAPLPELCHMRRWTGLDCPGCGMTRAFISIAHGRLADALRYNPGSFVMFPLIVLQIPYRAAQIWRYRRGLAEMKFLYAGRIVLTTLATVLLGQWILRQMGIGF